MTLPPNPFADSPLDLDALSPAVRGEVLALRSQVAALQESVIALTFWNRQLRRIVFGPRSERRVDPDQRDLFIEDVEQNLGESNTAVEAAEDAATAASGKKPARRGAARNLGALPAHLPRERRELLPASLVCDCGHPLHRIGEDVSERLKVIPRRYVVDQIVRPRFACRSCAEGVVQAPAPENAITGGMADTSVLADIVVQKYSAHLPLYRQQQALAAQGIALDRSTLSRWVGATAWWLRPLADLLRKEVLSRSVLFCDETRLPVLAPGLGRVENGTLWAVASDERPFASPLPPAVFYHVGRRAAADGREALGPFSGLLKVDGYGGYKAMAAKEGANLTLSFCFAHARRKVHEVFEQNKLPEAEDILNRIGALYDLERTIRGRPPEERKRLRQNEAIPILNALKTQAETCLPRFSGKSPFAKALRYLLSHWQGLIAYCDDGRLEIDTNTVERQMRPIALGRKNHLFAGSEAGAIHWALFASLINTAKLNNIDPAAYIADSLKRMVEGKITANNLEQILPWNWKA